MSGKRGRFAAWSVDSELVSTCLTSAAGSREAAGHGAGAAGSSAEDHVLSSRAPVHAAGGGHLVDSANTGAGKPLRRRLRSKQSFDVMLPLAKQPRQAVIQETTEERAPSRCAGVDVTRHVSGSASKPSLWRSSRAQCMLTLCNENCRRCRVPSSVALRRGLASYAVSCNISRQVRELHTIRVAPTWHAAVGRPAN